MPTILKAASIITMDPAKPRAEAVVVDPDTGRILAVGTVEECSKEAAGAAVQDLGTTVLVPGFVEAHSHPLVSGIGTQPPAHWIAPYVGYPHWSDVTALFEKLEKETPRGRAVLFNGLDRLLQGADSPGTETLDHYFPDRPAAILDNSGHVAYFNSTIIRQRGWDTSPPEDPVGARFGRNADGSPDGRAYELPAVLEVLTPVIHEVVQHPLYSAAEWYALMARNGITSTSDMTYDSSMLSAYEALASTADCPLRVSLYQMSTTEGSGEAVSPKAPETMLRKQGIKLWADGSPWVGTAALSFAYLETDVVKKAGIPIGPSDETAMNYSRAELDEILDLHAPQGWQMAFHVNGDVEIDIVLDAYERALAKHGLAGTDHRWRMEHCGAARRDQFERAAAMGVVVSLGPFQFIYWGDLLDGQLFPPGIGAPWMRFKDAVDAGVRPSFHNDGSVSPPIPLLNIQTAVTRTTDSGTVHGPEQIISLDDALAAETINAASMLFRDHEVGSITPGKLADLVELSMDPYLADPLRLASEVKVTGTWLGGRRLDLDGFLKEVQAMDPGPHEHLARPHPKCC